MIVRQMKAPHSGRWFRIEQDGETFTVRPKGGRKGGREETVHLSLHAALDRVNGDRPPE